MKSVQLTRGGIIAVLFCCLVPSIAMDFKCSLNAIGAYAAPLQDAIQHVVLPEVGRPAALLGSFFIAGITLGALHEITNAYFCPHYTKHYRVVHEGQNAESTDYQSFTSRILGYPLQTGFKEGIRKYWKKSLLLGLPPALAAATSLLPQANLKSSLTMIMRSIPLLCGTSVTMGLARYAYWNYLSDDKRKKEIEHYRLNNVLQGAPIYSDDTDTARVAVDSQTRTCSSFAWANNMPLIGGRAVSLAVTCAILHNRITQP